METTTRASRHDTSQPIVRKGKKVITVPSEREEQELFPILDLRSGRSPWSYYMLPRDYIAALLPDWGPEYIRKRFPKLTHEPNNYLRQPEMQTGNHFLNARSLVYCHPNTALSEDEFWHDLMSNMMAAQIEIGVRQDPTLQIANLERILSAPSMPADGSRSSTIEIPRPDFVNRRGKNVKAQPWRVTPDWQIFGVGLTDASAFRFYCGIEADKGTEPMTTGTKRKSVQSMLKRSLEIDGLRLAKKLYGLPEFYFPMVFSTPARMNAAIDILYELTNGAGHPRVIFNTFPVYNSFRTPLPPDGGWFCSTWKRAVGKGAAWSDEYRMDKL